MVTRIVDQDMDATEFIGSLLEDVDTGIRIRDVHGKDRYFRFVAQIVSDTF